MVINICLYTRMVSVRSRAEHHFRGLKVLILRFEAVLQILLNGALRDPSILRALKSKNDLMEMDWLPSSGFRSVVVYICFTREGLGLRSRRNHHLPWIEGS
ncbi:hypothetical protein AVEN_4139-1 [Araneus ventricosus]|uniref:Uncharacterized protein n=1 Tax=Araneus ventricosus TaxID=182803 RepID=A0A4Y2TV99_ARAVE|nr:hypothetical protein AVEN_4139-1 [Araneus ventricosus]